MKATIHIDKDTVNEVPISKFVPGNTGDGATIDPSCNTTVTLSCLDQLYKIGNYKPQATHKNSIAISSYLEQFLNEQDLRSFYLEQRPEAVNSTFEFISVNGEKNLPLLVYHTENQAQVA
jgi:tripeptidyl-peptidase-1